MNENTELKGLDHSYEAYDLYDTLTVCSNQLIETTHILKSSLDWVPLSIRKGQNPRVWLSAVISDGPDNQPTKYLDLIVNSEVKHNAVQFMNSKHGFKIIIDNIVVIEAGNHDKGNLEIIKMDLSPIGLAIEGDIHGLKVGGMTMSRSGVRKSNTFIGI
jgi:hypothetical protein